MNSFVLGLMKGHMGRIWIIFFLLAVSSAYFSFGGMSLGAENFIDVARATVFAIASGLTIYAFWLFALNIVPFLKNPRQIIIAWITVIGGVIMIVFISCMMNMTSFAGKEASEMFLRWKIQEYTEILRVTYEDALGIAAIGVDASGYEIKYETLSDDEYRRGIYSQTDGGTGAVHRSLVSITGSMSQLVDETSAFGRKTEKLHKSASGHLQEMRRIRLQGKPLRVRMRMIEEQSILLAKDLADINPRLLAKSIKRRAESLPSEIDVSGITYSLKPKTARKQREAIERLIRDVGRTSESLSSIAQDIAESERQVLQQFQPVSPSRATRIMWVNFLPHWVAAIAIDCIGLPILIFMSVVFSGKTEEDIQFGKVTSMTVEDLLLTQIANDAIRLGPKDPRGLKRLIEYTLGQQTQNDGDDQ